MPDGFPRVAGIYCVYAGTYDADNKKWSVRALLYIGESADVHARFVGATRRTLYLKHDYKNYWHRHLKDGESLLFAVASYNFSPDVRRDAERALIFKTRPLCNYFSLKNPNYMALYWRTTTIRFLVKGDWYSMGYGQCREEGIKCEEVHIMPAKGSSSTHILRRL